MNKLKAILATKQIFDDEVTSLDKRILHHARDYEVTDINVLYVNRLIAQLRIDINTRIESELLNGDDLNE